MTKNKKIVAIISAVLAVLIAVPTVVFFAATRSIGWAYKYSEEHSARENPEFELHSMSEIGTNGKKRWFWVAKGGKEHQRQEMIIFESLDTPLFGHRVSKNVSFFVTPDTEAKKPDNPNKSSVGMTYVPYLDARGKETPLKTYYFYSDNLDHIDSCYCTMLINDEEVRFRIGVRSGQAMMVEVPAVGKSTCDVNAILLKAEFYSNERLVTTIDITKNQIA